jgi:hypothetical protein
LGDVDEVDGCNVLFDMGSWIPRVLWAEHKKCAFTKGFWDATVQDEIDGGVEDHEQIVR